MATGRDSGRGCRMHDEAGSASRDADAVMERTGQCGVDAMK